MSISRKKICICYPTWFSEIISQNYWYFRFWTNRNTCEFYNNFHLNKAAVFVSFLTFFDISFGRAVSIVHLVTFPARISRSDSSTCCSRCSRCSCRLGEEISLSFSFIILLGISVCGLSLKTKKNFLI